MSGTKATASHFSERKAGKADVCMSLCCSNPTASQSEGALSETLHEGVLPSEEAPEGVYVVTQSCPTLCDLMECGPPGSSVHRILQAEYWSGLPFLSPGALLSPEIEPGSPTLQADSLQPEPHSEKDPECSYGHKLQHFVHNPHQYMLSAACPGRRKMSSEQ